MSRIRCGALAAAVAFTAAGVAGADEASKENAKKARALARERFQARAAELVKAADADGDGVLSQTEFEPLLKQAHDARAEIVKAARAEAGLPAEEKKDRGQGRKEGDKNADKDGTRDEAKRAEFAKKWDKDGDGKLSPDERKAAHEGERQAKLAANMKKADADSDGKITADEATKFIVGGGHDEGHGSR